MIRHLDQLSQQQRSILQQLAYGRSKADIEQVLFLPVGAYDAEMKAIKRWADASTVVAACIVYGETCGLAGRVNRRDES